jgi:hypothetical protein
VVEAVKLVRLNETAALLKLAERGVCAAFTVVQLCSSALVPQQKVTSVEAPPALTLPLMVADVSKTELAVLVVAVGKSSALKLRIEPVTSPPTVLFATT